jgi:uncharacterized protein YdeI (YjbR/CyaY-like superfamily)
MQSQKGIALPDDFAESLQAQQELLAIFERMRPSCQRDYVDWINQVDESQARSHRIIRVLAKVSKWGERHPVITSEASP